MSSGPHEGASALELSAELVARHSIAGRRTRDREWTLSYGDETYAFAAALLPGESPEAGFMAPPSGPRWWRRRQAGSWSPGW